MFKLLVRFVEAGLQTQKAKQRQPKNTYKFTNNEWNKTPSGSLRLNLALKCCSANARPDKSGPSLVYSKKRFEHFQLVPEPFPL